MKRLFIIIMFVMTATTVVAQKNYDVHAPQLYTGLDTIWAYERVPNYYYWDTFWFDKYCNKPGYTDVEWSPQDWYGQGNCQPEFARCCYTDKPLRVIGLAVAVRMTKYSDNPVDTVDPWINTEPDYLRLYTVDTTNDSMMLLASKSWYGLKPAHLQCAFFGGIRATNVQYYNKNYYCPIFEVYFDSAITVRDSFYVSMTNNNSCSAQKPYYGSSITLIQGFRYGQLPDNEFLPVPNHFRRKLHQLPNASYPDRAFMGFHVTDTNWHTFAHIWRNEYGVLGADMRFYAFLFAIIDTSHYSADTICDVPGSLGVMNSTPEAVMLSWEGTDAGRWELSVGPLGCIPETGTPSIYDNPVATLTGLQQGQMYSAWVRSICDSTLASHWSERLDFLVPEDTTQTQSTGSIVDIQTQIVPNPAKEQVSVISSYRISAVEVWTMDGRQALGQRSDGNTVTIDISSLSRGSYILRITTDNGMTYKKLAVE